MGTSNASAEEGYRRQEIRIDPGVFTPIPSVAIGIVNGNGTFSERGSLRDGNNLARYMLPVGQPWEGRQA
jgi:hypothetical protein